MGELSGVSPGLPVPAKVVMTPVWVVTLRITLLRMSQM